MKTSSQCSECGKWVRDAIDADGNPILIDPQPEKMRKGCWYTIGYQQGVPVMEADPPEREPFTYRTHLCDAV